VENLAYRCLDPHGRKHPTIKEATLELEWIMGTELGGNEEHQLLHVHSTYYSLPIVSNEEDESWDRYSTSNSLPCFSS